MLSLFFSILIILGIIFIVWVIVVGTPLLFKENDMDVSFRNFSENLGEINRELRDRLDEKDREIRKMLEEKNR